MQNIQTLVAKLSKFYWGPKHPEEYVIPVKVVIGYALKGDKTIPVFIEEYHGLGCIAGNSYAAFNLVYLFMRGEINTPAEHAQAVEHFHKFHMFAASNTVEGTPLEDYCTMLSQTEFARWYKDKREALPLHMTMLLDILTAPDVQRMSKS